MARLSVVESTVSTNDDVRELARTGAPSGTAVAARAQTKGRGRRGHTWASPQGGLYLSVLLRPRVPMSYFTGLCAVTSLGVLEALRACANSAQIALKWPNDIVFEGRKLAGVLLEAGSADDGPYAVAGIGVNLMPVDARAAVESQAALEPVDLASIADTIPEFEELALSVRDAVVVEVDEWQQAVEQGRAQKGPLEPVLMRYYDAIELLGRRVAAFNRDGAALGTGMFAGIDEWGRALVRLDDGTKQRFAAEQVSLRSLV